MRPAQERMADVLNALPFQDLELPLINNWQAAEVRTAEEARRGLYEQIPNAVRWTDTIRRMAAAGVTQYIEVGAGSVLSGLCRAIEPNWKGARFGEASDMEKVRALFA
jgi:[acyl-carrier-protein] S-malonyltransferase